jgi:protein TonB
MLQRLRSLLIKLTLLQICLGASAMLHIGLLSFRFVDPEGFNRTFKDTPLDVILVNAGSETPPDKAQALAQLNLAGGGEGTGRATSPLPPSPQAEMGDALEQAARMIDQMQQEQAHLLTQVKNELSALPPPQPLAKAQTEQSRADEERRRLLSKLLAEIEKRIREENTRPKKRFISPATMKAADAMYYSLFRNQVERMGTDHFPTHNGQKLYGEMYMIVTLDRLGKVRDTDITMSSGNKMLDKRAAEIVKQGGPYGRIPPEVIAGKDLLLISSRFRFTRDEGVQALTQAPAAAPMVPNPAATEP